MAEFFPIDVSSIGSYSGSFSGSFQGNGSRLTGITASYLSGSVTSASYAATASYLLGSIASASYSATASYVNPLVQNVIITGSIYIPDSTNSIYFSGSGAASRLVWNDTDGTLDLGLKGGNVTLQIGQEQVIRVVNKTGANLLESQYYAVRVRSVSEGGAQGQRLAVVLAQANNDANSATTIGLVTENIDVNQEGFITTFGLVRNIDTTGTLQGETWVDGDMLYLSPTTSGSITNIKPQAPQHTVIIGYVVYAHANNGKIFVKVDNGYELDELHNVKITTASLSSGDLLVYSSSVWVNTKQLTGSYGLTGSLQATSFTGSLLGTSSFTTSASYATQAGNAAAIDIYSFSSPVESYLLMSNVVGTTGVAVGGDTDLRYNSSTNVLTVPNISATTLTGSLLGTASNAVNALTASFINSASTNAFVQGGNSFGTTAVLGTNDNQSLAFRTNGSTKMLISGSGVGIGNIPQSGFSLDTISNIVTRASFYVNNDIYFFGASNSNIRISGLRFTDIGTSTTQVNISTAGNLGVGIGTTAATSRLQVRGSGTTSATTALRVENTNTSASLVVLDNGNVGIGTTSPSFLLDVSGSGRFTNGLTVTGSLTATSFTGSLLGTSSWAVSASQAITASYVINAISASFVTSASQAVTASYVLNAVSSSFASTASYSNTLGAALSNQSDGTLRLVNSANTTISSVLLTASLANTASFVNTLRQNVILSGSLLVSSSILGSGSFYNTTIDLIGSAVSTNNNTGSITFGTKYLIDNNNLRSVRWNERYLTDSSQSISVDWNSRTLVSGSTNVLNWSSGTGSLIGTSSWAVNAVSASFLPVGTYNITSSWAVSASQAISASRATTSSFAISASWAPTTLAFPYVGTAIITGSLIVSGTYGGINTSINKPTLFDANGVARVLWAGGLLVDTNNTISVDWQNRYLQDSVETTRVDWQNGTLNDSTGAPSIDWESRVLSEPTTTWVAFEYSNDIATTSQLYHRAVIPAQVQRSISDTPIYAGQVIQATIDLGVLNYQLVFLDTDGTWKGTKATVANGANKMLGIAVDTAGGYVLIEGDVGVSDDNSQGGYVVGADHGLPVYVSGNTGEMTTTAPSGVGELVRIVGHIYYQSTTDPNWWTMKFRPSNDWYEQ